MALEIRNIPVLTGSTAESFVRAAEEHERPIMERIRLASDCTLYPIDKNTDLSSFCCGDEDLDDFFRNDA